MVAETLRKKKVNEEIEANIQVTREIESEIVNCAEIETSLAVRESELTKSLFMSHFEINGLLSVTAASRNSLKFLEDKLCQLKKKRDEMLKRMREKREEFTRLCLQFQWDINKEKNDELLTLLSEREALENDVHLLDKKNNALQNSMLAFAEEIIEELHNTNSALHAEIQNQNQENEKLLKEIDGLRSALLPSW